MDRIRVMIAEDEAAVRESLARVVDSDPRLEVVATAEDTERAIDLAVMQRPHVALLDVRMPGGGGPRAAREIGRRCPPTRLVAVSAFQDRESVLAMLRAGAHNYIVKGASNEEILQTIHRSASGENDTLAIDEALRTLDEIQDGRADRGRRGEGKAARIRQVLDSGALTMVFQPIFDLRDDLIVGLEALARFSCSPRRSPDAWFAEADSAGMLLELELAAVDAAFASLPDIPQEQYLAVNVSPQTLATDDFLACLDRVPGERIVLEITEHAPIDDYDRLNEALRRLRSRGSRLAVDDVGAGFSSLRHIVRLAPEIIKIDITLTRNVHIDPTRQALVAALLGFGSNMGAVVVAEGVEIAAQLRGLQSLGVRFAQGFHLGRPGPLDRRPRSEGVTP